MKYVQEITLDVNPNSSFVTVTAKQDDVNSRKLLIHFTKDGEKYKINSNRVWLRVRKPDGHFVLKEGTINEDEGTVEVNLTPQILAVPGRAYADIIEFNDSSNISNTSDTLSTASFIIIIQAQPSSPVFSSDDFLALKEFVDHGISIINTSTNLNSAGTWLDESGILHWGFSKEPANQSASGGESTGDMTWLANASADISELKSAVGSTTFALDESILKIKYPVIYSNMSIKFDCPAGGIYNNYITGIIPLPKTLDGQITHNGYGYHNYRAIVFYDDTKTPISSAENSQFASIVTPIPNNAAFFRLHYYGEDVHGLRVSFNLSAAEKANYLRTLMHAEPDFYIYDFDVQNMFTLEHTEIDTTTGVARYDNASNYSATDFILLPDNIELLGTYAYTVTGRARVAFYDANKDLLRAVYSASQRLASTEIPEGAVFVRFGTHSTIPPASCLAVGLIKSTKSNDEIIDMIRQALV